MVCVAALLEVEDDVNRVEEELVKVCATAHRTDSASVIKSKRMMGCSSLQRFGCGVSITLSRYAIDTGLHHDLMFFGFDGQNKD